MINLYKNINKKTHRKKKSAWQKKIESDKIKKKPQRIILIAK